jgi:hypothetical protein
MSLPQGRQVTRVELLRANTNIPFTGGAGTIEFTIPRVLDYEVAALYSAQLFVDALHEIRHVHRPVGIFCLELGGERLPASALTLPL